jgi:hypothetical protein
MLYFSHFLSPRLSAELFNQSQLQRALQTDYNVLDEQNKILERKLHDAVDTHRLVVTRLQEAIAFEHDLMYLNLMIYFFFIYRFYLVFLLAHGYEFCENCAGCHTAGNTSPWKPSAL